METTNRILIADDDAISRAVLGAYLARWGFEVVVGEDGDEAWTELQKDDGPQLAILDWMMPGVDGVELCRRARQLERTVPWYLIILTAKGQPGDLVEALEAGADDFITKPFDPGVVKARVSVGVRVTSLQTALARRVEELEHSLETVRRLSGLLPICMYCKRIRDDQDYWHEVEQYVTQRSEAEFSHGICPGCYGGVVEPMLSEREKQR